MIKCALHHYYTVRLPNYIFAYLTILYLQLGVTIASKMLPICTCRSTTKKCLFHCMYDLMSYTLFYINYLLQLYPGTPERCEGKGGRFSWKGTFELICTKRCLQNIGSWTSPNHVFYWLDDRGVRGFSARRLCYSWSSMTAFLAFSEANS
jgi:hypothetical protein